jgi:glucose/arabinose dehydrogenase
MPLSLVRTSGKTTYCLHDVFRLDSPPPGSPLTPGYPGCDAKVQGISAGWVDVYDMSLAGQQVDIEGLPDGRYLIKSTADPADLVLERDETNNSATAVIEIKGTEVSIIGGAGAPAGPGIEIIAGNLDVPWAIDFSPDGRIFFTERSGRIRIIQNGMLLPEPWLSLDVAAVGEGGLLGLAIDPGFTDNHYLYAAYTYRGAGGALYNRLVRLREDTGSRKGVLDKVLIESITGGSVHDGGRVKIGPDGKLYWTIGEAGSPALAQEVSSLNGKILRINTDGTIPPDNPFPGSPVYSYGHRNPQGLAWQPGTGRLYATEHGPSGGTYGVGQDEVNFIEPGKNYGWPLIIGNSTHDGMVSPVLQSGPSETWAPAGAAFVGSGPWAGSFLFTGLRGQSLYRMVPDRDDPRKIISFEKLFQGEYGRLRDVAWGPERMIYILTNNRDGRGSPQKGDDKILRLKLE